MKLQSLCIARIIAVMILSFLTLNIAHAQVLFSAQTSPYTQNFDTLANAPSGGTTPWGDNSTIVGWYSSHSNTPGSFSTYRISNNLSTENTGALYSYGAAASSDRALGSTSSGNASVGNLSYGVRFQNDTVNAITAITVSYTGEQWRNGGNANANPLSFFYRVSSSAITDADAANTATWIPVTVLDFISPTLGPAAAALDGNASANRIALSSALAGVTVGPGEEIFFRWLDVNDAGNDHGLAVDDLSISFTSGPPNNNPPSIATQPVNATAYAGNSASFTVSAAGQSPLAYQWYYTNGVLNTPVSGATSAFLNLTTVTNGNAGQYYVIVTNNLGSTNSAVVTLTVLPAIVTNIAYLHTLMDANRVLTNKTTPFQIEGVCLTPVNLVSNSGTAFSFHIGDYTGHGIDVFHRGGFSPNIPAVGDWVRVVGPLDQFNGLTEISPAAANPAHSITVISNGAALPTPRILNLADAANATIMEDYEGAYVIVSNIFAIVNTTANLTFPITNFSVTLSNAPTQTLTMFVPQPAVGIQGFDIPTNAASITGVISQNDSSSPFDSGYQLVVTLYSDINTNAPSTNAPAAAGTPRITSAVRAGSTVVVSGTNGTVSGTYYVITSTNIATARAAWSSVATNNFDGSGNFIFTNPISGPQQFINIRQLP